MMLCGQSNPLWHWAAGAHPGKVGLLLGPSYYRKQNIREWMPYALDNDAFTAYVTKAQWNVEAWREMLARIRLNRQKPVWALVPDVVADRLGTLENWERYNSEIKRIGWKAAFAVQDGMTKTDVPSDADVVFVGGTDAFKWQTVEMWASEFKRVHVGRVNEIGKVWLCQRLGVESVDGTGWFRDPSRADKLPALTDWIVGNEPEQHAEFLLSNTSRQVRREEEKDNG
jgi:hypothetical protein